MRIAHLLLTHEYTAQLERLIKRLGHPEADIYIHVDLKTPIANFEPLNKLERVYFVDKRVKVYWGAYSIVQATINGFRQILGSGNNYGYINLLSGQDYPLQPVENMHRFLAQNPGKAFMEYYLVNEVWTEAIPRLTKFHLANYPFAGHYAAEKWLNKLTPARKMPHGLLAVGRSQWFSLATELVVYILNYIDHHPAFVRFFKLTWAPDELFFQTILYNSPHQKDMVNDNLRYIDWGEKKASPKTFTINDLPMLKASGKFFGRKFNAKVDEKVLDGLDGVGS